MAASMKSLSPSLRVYLRTNRLPDVYEALLTGLAIMCPDDPYQFILDKIKYLLEFGSDGLQWDLFVDSFMKPVSKVISESNLESVFNMDDDFALPRREMNEMAYKHYNSNALKLCFCKWMQYYLMKRMEKMQFKYKIECAEMHHTNRMLNVYFKEWMEWVKYRKGRQAMAFHKIEHIMNVGIGRVIFEAWHDHTMDARQQREYFERLELGENMEDDDSSGQGTGEVCDSLSMLPKKIAIQIFKYLDISDLVRCASVCRSWKVISQTNSLWNMLDFYRVRTSLREGYAKNLDNMLELSEGFVTMPYVKFNEFGLEEIHRVTDKAVTKLLSKYRTYLIHLNMRGYPQVFDPSFTSISECSNIQDLNLSECSGLNDETLTLVTKGCKILIYLNLCLTDITDASLRSIAKYCHNLQYLSLAHCKRFSDHGLLYLASGRFSIKLFHLDLSGCMQITPDGFKNLSAGCMNLQTLMLNDLQTFSDDCLIPIANCLTKINTISFLGSPQITDNSLIKIASNGNLKKIKIEGNHRISDLSLRTMGVACDNLEHVYITDCPRLTDVSLKYLGMCKNLIVVNFADCVRISDKGVRYLVEGPCGSTLRELNLTNCLRVGDMGMVAIHKRCHSLTYLSVCFCEHIGEAGIELLGQTLSLTSIDISGCNCSDQGLLTLGNNTRLRDVTLSECINISDLGLQKFAQQCKNIERLDLSHCLQITDGAIKNLAFCCRMLNVLNLAGCRLLTDLGIQYLSGVCHYLIKLDVSGCILITDKALKYIRKSCLKMKQLTLLYCQGINKNSAQKMNKHIEVVEYSSEPVPSFYGY